MVLCQIVINQSASKQYNINVYGRKRFKIISIMHHQSAGNAFIPVEIRCPSLRLVKGNNPFLVYFVHNNNNASPLTFYNFEDLYLDGEIIGNIEIALIDASTNQPVANFGAAVLYLDVQDIEN